MPTYLALHCMQRHIVCATQDLQGCLASLPLICISKNIVEDLSRHPQRECAVLFGAFVTSYHGCRCV